LEVGTKESLVKRTGIKTINKSLSKDKEENPTFLESKKVQKKPYTKDSLLRKEENPSDFTGKQINSFIKLFEKVNPTYERLYSNKTQRSALERLLKKFGIEKVRNLILYLPSLLGKEYAPVVATPLQLENKLSQVVNYKIRELNGLNKIKFSSVKDYL